jgi:kynurenine formamidase
MWNGFPASSVTSQGAASCGIQNAGPVVTRGLLLDFSDSGRGMSPGEAIGAEGLADAAAAAGLEPEPGDALLLRTGWLRQWRDGTAGVDACPGLAADCAGWLGEHGIALVGADNIAVEAYPAADGSVLPLHIATLRDRGIYLLELLDLEELARHGAAEFLLVVAPLNIVGGVGSPVAPVAVV